LKTSTYSDVVAVDLVAASVRAVASGASERSAACVAADSGSQDRCRRVAVAVAVAVAVDIAVGAVASGPLHLVAGFAVVPCLRAKRSQSNCTGCPFWYIVCMVSLLHILDVDLHTLRKPVKHDCVG